MKAYQLLKYRNGRLTLIGALLLVWTLAGCTAIAPKPDQLQLPSEPPMVRETSFSKALNRLGLLSEIYGANLMKIQIRELDDVTGTSYHTGGEIPKSITVMVKSALNSIGGQVVYIPFWPDYFAGIQVSGYAINDQKLLPDVILAGGITEFDRGLTTLDRSRNLDAQTGDLRDASSALPGRTIGLDYAQGDKWNMAKIAVDFNLVSFQAMFGIPKMQASNGITVYKGIKEEELGFTLFGPTIGVRGSVKKVQGRHDAVRMLVQFSVIQLDDETKAALAKVDNTFDSQATAVPVDTFIKLYLSVPVSDHSKAQGRSFDRLWAHYQELEKQKALKEKQKKSTTPKPKKRSIKKQPPVEKAKPKATEPSQEAPKHEVIIITPLDAQTHHILRRIVRRIEDKRKNEYSIQETRYPSLTDKSKIVHPTP
jgi:hypothetical protein